VCVTLGARELRQVRGNPILHLARAMIGVKVNCRSTPPGTTASLAETPRWTMARFHEHLALGWLPNEMAPPRTAWSSTSGTRTIAVNAAVPPLCILILQAVRRQSLILPRRHPPPHPVPSHPPAPPTASRSVAATGAGRTA